MRRRVQSAAAATCGINADLLQQLQEITDNLPQATKDQVLATDSLQPTGPAADSQQDLDANDVDDEDALLELAGHACDR
jgi:hypothetical protein